MSDPWNDHRRNDSGRDDREVRDLLERLVAAPPPETITTADIVRRARRSRRRRTTAALLGVAALVLVVGAVGALVIPQLTRAQRSAVVAGGLGPVVTVEGSAPVDQRDLGGASLPLVEPSRSAASNQSGLTALAVAGGGQAHLLLPSLTDPAALRLVLIGNPSTVSSGLSPPPGLAAFPRSSAARAIDGRRVVQIATSGSTWRVSVYDIQRTVWSQFTIDRGRLRPEVGASARISATRLAGERIYFTVRSSAARPSGGDPLFSVGVRGDEVRYEQVDTDVWDAEGGVVAWAPVRSGDVTFTVRTIATPRDIEVEVPESSGCRPTDLALGPQRIALTQSCGGGVDRVRVSDLRGQQAFSLEGRDLENADASRGTVVVSSPSPDNPGCFVYDIASGTLVRLSSTPIELHLVVGMAGDRIFLPVGASPTTTTGPAVSWIDWRLA